MSSEPKRLVYKWALRAPGSGPMKASVCDLPSPCTFQLKTSKIRDSMKKAFMRWGTETKQTAGRPTSGLKNLSSKQNKTRKTNFFIPNSLTRWFRHSFQSDTERDPSLLGTGAPLLLRLWPGPRAALMLELPWRVVQNPRSQRGESVIQLLLKICTSQHSTSPNTIMGWVCVCPVFFSRTQKQTFYTSAIKKEWSSGLNFALTT